MIRHRINDILSYKKKSLYWLAQETGISYQSLFNITKGKTLSINFDTLEKIMNALEIKDFNEILYIDNKKEP